MIEGLNNNAKDTTGRVVDVPIEAVAEFSLLQNQFSAEFGRSTGGQFNTVVKSGANGVHALGGAQPHCVAQPVFAPGPGRA